MASKFVYDGARRPSPYVLKAASQLRVGSDAPLAIDVGAGFGRHSFLLAMLGFQVIAIERDRQLATRIRSLAKLNRLAIRVAARDALAYVPRRSIDLVCIVNLLHHLPRGLARRMVERHREMTAPGGVHVAVAFTVGPPDLGVGHAFGPGELRTLYEGWEIREYREWVERPLRYGGPRALRHPFAAIIARRPLESRAGRRSKNPAV